MGRQNNGAASVWLPLQEFVQIGRPGSLQDLKKFHVHIPVRAELFFC